MIAVGSQLRVFEAWVIFALCLAGVCLILLGSGLATRVHSGLVFSKLLLSIFSSSDSSTGSGSSSSSSSSSSSKSAKVGVVSVAVVILAWIWYGIVAIALLLLQVDKASL